MTHTVSVLLSPYDNNNLPNLPGIEVSVQPLRMSGRQTNTSKNASKLVPKKTAKTVPEDSKENKGNVPDTQSSPGGGSDDGGTPVSTGEPGKLSQNKSIADQVMDHFTSHWETFKTAFKQDLDSLTRTVYDEESGLVPRVQILEQSTNSLETRVSVLEDAASIDPPPTSSLQSRIEKLEKLASTTDPAGFGARIAKLEESEAAGFGTRLAKLEENQKKIMVEDDLGEMQIKIPDEMQLDVGVLRRDVDTISGFMHIMGRNIKSVEHKVNLNAAKLMRRSAIG